LGLGSGVYLSVGQALVTQVLPSAAARAKDLGVISIAGSGPLVLGSAIAALVVTGLGQQQMRRFFADASHELRTPLASLRANAELYQQGALSGPDEVAEVMDRIVLETRRMGRVVDDMLRLARLGQHPGRSRELVDLTAVVIGCAERARIADPARTWQVRIAGGLVRVGDEELLRRAVDNLLMNVPATGALAHPVQVL
jgi:signal transduction histidine kinase